MKDFAEMQHHHLVQKIVDILSKRTQNTDRAFFEINTCYHLTKLAALMGTRVDAGGLGNSAVNFYAINLAPSGYGKGHSTKIIEKQITHRFKKKYLEFTVPSVAEKRLRTIADERSLRKNTDAEEEYDKTVSEYKSKGAMVYTFDDGTAPAVKQFREKILLGGIGSINFECDEIGTKLLGVKDIIDVYLELYDGSVKQKLIKNTNDNKRSEEIDGETPTNMLMFGEPTMLFDGSTNETLMHNLFTTGYARRCFFGFSAMDVVRKELTVDERMQMLKDTTSDTELTKIAVLLEKLADESNFGVTVKLPDSTLRLLVEYQMYCEKVEASFKTTDTIRRAEARGRYYKTLRLAAVFTWLDSLQEMTEEHLEAAIKVAEESAQSFYKMLTRPPVYARLAQYLAEETTAKTHAELMEELPYYPKASGKQIEIIKNSIAWGHKHNVIIKRTIRDDIEFIQGEALEETNIENGIILSHSTDFAEGYRSETKVPFNKLEMITQNPTFNWCAHRFVDGHRKASRAIQGFNLIVLDIDEGTSISVAQEVLKDYTYHIYTSKSHGKKCEKNPQGEDRFRIVIPTSHILKMDEENYKEFMSNVHEFLPFVADTQTGEIARKWEGCQSDLSLFNEGKLFDVLPFIPKTKKNQERQEAFKAIENTSGIVRWFLMKIKENGHRNNHLMQFGYMLIDGGITYEAAEYQVAQLNDMLDEPLTADELRLTVYKSMMTHLTRKG